MTPAERRTRAKRWAKFFPDLSLDLWFGGVGMGGFETCVLSTKAGGWVALAMRWPSYPVTVNSNGEVKLVPDFDAPAPEYLEVVAVCKTQAEADETARRRFEAHFRARGHAWQREPRDPEPEPEQLKLAGLDQSERPAE